MADPQRRNDGGRHMTAPKPRFKFLRCLCITALAAIVAVGLALLIIWLVIRPAPLEYTVEDAQVHGFNITRHRLNGTFHISLRSDNRNKKVSLYYDSIEVTVLYYDQTIAFGDVAPFFQPSRNASWIRVDAMARSTPLMASVSKQMKQDRSKGKIQLEVRVVASIRFRVARLKSKHYTLEVYCSPVVLNFSPNEPFQRSFCDVDI